MTFSIFRDTIPNIDRENSAIEILLFGVFYERMMIMKKVLKLLSCSVLLGLCYVGSTGGMNPPPPPPPPPPPGKPKPIETNIQWDQDEAKKIAIEQAEKRRQEGKKEVGLPTPNLNSKILKKYDEGVQLEAKKSASFINEGFSAFWLNDTEIAAINREPVKKKKNSLEDQYKHQKKGKYSDKVKNFVKFDIAKDMSIIKQDGSSQKFSDIITTFPLEDKYFQKDLIGGVLVDRLYDTYQENGMNKSRLLVPISQFVKDVFKAPTGGLLAKLDLSKFGLTRSNFQLFKTNGSNLLLSEISQYVEARLRADINSILGFEIFDVLKDSVPQDRIKDFESIFANNINEFFLSYWEMGILVTRTISYFYPAVICAATKNSSKPEISALYDPANLVLPKEIDVAHVRKDLLASKLWHFFLDEHPEIKLTGEQIKALVEYAPVVAWMTVGKIKVGDKDPKQLTELFTIKAGDVNLSEKVNNYLKHKNGDITLGDAVDHLNNQTAEAVKDYDSYFE